MKSKAIKYIQKLIYPEGTTHLPAMAITISFLLMTLNAMTTTALYSFLPKMVKEFGASEIGAGTFAGIVASSIYVGRLFFSSFWGYVTDNKGKKFALITSGTTLVLSTAAFGFSSDFYWATVTRFVQGCCMGLVIIVRVWLADVCDESNMSLGMSMIITAYSVGLIIGPCIGGFTAFPADLYPSVFSKKGIFAKFGVLLPVAVIDFALALTVVLGVIYIPGDDKTKTKKSKEAKDLENEPLLHSKNYLRNINGSFNECSSIEKNHILARNITNGERDKVIRSNSLDENRYLEEGLIKDSYQIIGEDDTKISCVSFVTNLSIVRSFKQSKLYQVLRVKECVYSSLLYCWISLNDIGFAEIFPLLVATDPSLNGMGLTTKDIGSILMIVAVSVTGLQVTISPRIMDHFGPKKALMYSNLVLIFLYPILGSLCAVKKPSHLWVCLIVYRILVNAATFTAIVCVNILVNNSVDADLLGSAYGVSMTLASVGRMIAPILFGTLFSWSLTNIKGVPGNKRALGFPFNHYFVLFLHSLFSLCTVLFVTKLPDSVNVNKKMTEDT